MIYAHTTRTSSDLRACGRPRNSFQAIFVHAVPEVEGGKPGISLIATRTSVVVNVAFFFRLSQIPNCARGVSKHFWTPISVVYGTATPALNSSMAPIHSCDTDREDRRSDWQQ